MIPITLREIKYINNEIKRLRSKLERIESEVYRVTPKLGDSPSGGGAGDKIGLTVPQMTDIKMKIQSLELKRNSAVNSLNCEIFEENCLYMRIKLHYSWAKIAIIVGSSPDSVKKMCYRYSW